MAKGTETVKDTKVAKGMRIARGMKMVKGTNGACDTNNELFKEMEILPILMEVVPLLVL